MSRHSETRESVFREESFNGAYTKKFILTDDEDFSPDASQINEKIMEAVNEHWEDVFEVVREGEKIAKEYEGLIGELNKQMSLALEHTNLQKDCEFVPEYVD